MKFISKLNTKLIFIFLISFLLPNFVFAQSCSRDGYSIFTLNGIFTKESDAIKNKDDLIRFLPDSYNGEKITVNYLYNPTHGGGLGDIFDYIKQGLFDQKSDYDLTEILQDASSKITTQKLLLVAHSQGNFYSNNFYDKVAGIEGGIPIESIGVYGVASPASSVAGGGKYITSSTDNVIGQVRDRLDHSVLPSNTDIVLAQSDDPLGHNFTDVYLKYRSDRIIKEIKESLDKLKSNDVQNENMPCVNPPQITLGHKIQKGMLAIADPLANTARYIFGGIYNGASIVRDAGSNTIAWLYNTGHNIVASIFNLSRNSLASVADSVSENSDSINVGLGNLNIGGSDTGNKIEQNNPVSEDINTIDPSIEIDNSGVTITNESEPDSIQVLHIPHGGGHAGNDPVVTTTQENVEKDVTVPQDKVPENPQPPISIVLGKKINFDAQDRIYRVGDYILCNIDNHTVYANGNNTEMTFINSKNWNTPGMKDVNNSMTSNTNYHFIFGEYQKSVEDCTSGTFNNDYSNNFYYANASGDSIVYDPDTLNRIISFKFDNITNSNVIMYDTLNHISVYVPSDTNITNLVPVITISDKAHINYIKDTIQDYTNPVVYTVTSFDNSVQDYTVEVYPTLGKKIDFDSNNKIAYSGDFIFCNVDANSIEGNGGTIGYISSTNWRTPNMLSENENMTPNINYRFIFGSNSKTGPDCTGNNFTNNYSQTFYYKSNLGSSVMYGKYTIPVEPDPIPEPEPTPDPTPIPDPIPDPTPIPDTTPPAISSYTFNNIVGDITVNPVENPMILTLNASENVDWVSVRIEKQSDAGVFKTFFSGSGCVDFTNTCTKTWSDTSKGLLSSGVYRVKVNMKDIAGNVYQEYLTPYVINVDMTLPKN